MAFNYCPNCGTKQLSPANYCQECGNPLSDTSQKPNVQKNRSNSRIEKFMGEVVEATRGRSQSKVKVEYVDEEIRKSSENNYRESLAAATMALGIMLRGNEI